MSIRSGWETLINFISRLTTLRSKTEKTKTPIWLMSRKDLEKELDR